MATYTSTYSTRFRKPIRSVGIGIANAAGDADADVSLLTVDSSGNLLVDSAAPAFGSTGLASDVIAESTAAAGVTIDGLLIKDNDIDVSGQSTGAATVVLGDNLASAWAVLEAANSYLTFVTTNGSEAVAAGQRITTTDGVASGTARIVGGIAYRSVAASSVITNTTTETIFDENYSLPANTLKAGTVVRVSFWGTTPATNSTDTLTIRLRIGGVSGTAILSTAAIDVANSDVFTGFAELTCRTAGTGGTFVAHGHHSGPDAGGTAYIPETPTGSTAIDTTAAQSIVVTAEWSAASTGDTVRLDQFVVEVIG